MKLSVALVTRNRPEQLDLSIKSLRAQSVQPFEVIVSDDSDPERASQTQMVAAVYDCMYVQGPRRGLYANRNFVAQRCSGTHIRTMDDDHILPAGHLEDCIVAVEMDPGAIWTTGEMGYLKDQFVGVAKTAAQLGPSGYAQAITDPDDNWAIADGSTIYPKEVFDSGLRMIEYFGFGAAYLEFGAFIYRLGWKSRCIPQAYIEHRAVSLSPPNWASHRFASICFNLYFRPDIRHLFRYTVPDWRCWSRLPELFKLARKRWKK